MANVVLRNSSTADHFMPCPGGLIKGDLPLVTKTKHDLPPFHGHLANLATLPDTEAKQ